MTTDGFRGVLFDWRGTLVTGLYPHDWVREALLRLDRDVDDGLVAQVWTAIRTAAGQPDRLAAPNVDTSAVTHRHVYYAVFADAGLDSDLADALYDIESDPSYNLFAVDVAPTLRRLAAAGSKIGVISDIHFDLRPTFAAHDLLDVVDTFVLSYEHGMQKPDPAFFQVALEELGTTPPETLMVGDRASHDGAAVALGLTTLLLPPLASKSHARLHLVEGVVSAAALARRVRTNTAGQSEDVDARKN
jgi:HAD superfamily hydrolase (TIGR01549 family)